MERRKRVICFVCKKLIKFEKLGMICKYGIAHKECIAHVAKGIEKMEGHLKEGVKPKKKRIKKVASFSEMLSTTVYTANGEMFRKKNGILEKFEKGKWVGQKISFQLLNDTTFREY